MKLDRPRALLLDLIAKHQTDLKTVSLAIPRNHAYLQQYINRNVPQALPEDVREALGKHFRVDPDEFRGTPKPPEEDWHLLHRDTKVREIVKQAINLDDATLDAVLLIMSRFTRPDETSEPPPAPPLAKKKRGRRAKRAD